MKRFIYTAPLIVKESEPIWKVFEKIVALGSHEALVMDEQQHISGMVCLFDICKFFCSTEIDTLPTQVKNKTVTDVMHDLKDVLYFPSLVNDLKKIKTQFLYHKVPVFLSTENRHSSNLMGCFDLEAFGKEAVKELPIRSIKNTFTDYPYGKKA